MESAAVAPLTTSASLRFRRDACLRLIGPKGRLVLEFMDPSAGDGYCTGVRFTPMAFLLQAHYDGVPYFFLPDSPDPVMGNAGGAPLEFDLGEGSQPPGYEKAPVGGSFVKVGVGTLARLTGEPYGFWRDNPLVRRARVQVEHCGTRMIFRQQLRHRESGISYRLTITVNAEESAATFTVRLENSGCVAFLTEQYMHNFLAIGSGSTAAGMELEFPFEPVFRPHPDTVGILNELQVSGRRVRVLHSSFRPGKLELFPIQGNDFSGAFWLRGIGSRRALRIDCSMPVSRWALFLSPEQVSPEAFVRLSPAPGETVEFSRTYSFYR